MRLNKIISRLNHCQTIDVNIGDVSGFLLSVADEENEDFSSRKIRNDKFIVGKTKCDLRKLLCKIITNYFWARSSEREREGCWVRGFVSQSVSQSINESVITGSVSESTNH